MCVPQGDLSRATGEIGIEANSPAHDLLEELLAAQPAGALIDAWEAFVAALREETTAEVFAAIAGDVAERTRRVAEAAGGILGLGSIAQAEADALARVEAALR